MTIGIDIRPLQMHHRYRGIGMHMIKFVERLPKLVQGIHTVIFYEYEGMEDWRNAVVLPKNFRYQTVTLSQTHPTTRRLPFVIKEALQNTRRVKTPLSDDLLAKCDVFLTFDFMQGLPSLHCRPAVISVGYDLIPLLFPKDYYPNFFKAVYRTSINEALRDIVIKRLYKWAGGRMVDVSSAILTISNSTKEQFKVIYPQSTNKTHTVYLGAPDRIKVNSTSLQDIHKQLTNNYLLYVGGGDPRRKIDHLVSVFNKLKNSYPDLQLVLAGKDFTNISTIPTKKIKQAILGSPYIKDILFLGFVSDEQRTVLYRSAKAFVYPTLSEGFGLPLLEAMQESCPVVSYDAAYSSVKEVAGNAGIIVQPSEEALYTAVQKVLINKHSDKLIQKGLHNVKKFTWEDTARQTLKYIESVSKER